MAARAKAFFGKEVVIEKNILDLIDYNERLINSLRKIGKENIKRKENLMSKRLKKPFKHEKKFGQVFFPLAQLTKANKKLKNLEKLFIGEIKKLKKYEEAGDVMEAIKHANKAEEIIRYCEDIIIKEYREALDYFGMYPEEKRLRQELVEALIKERKLVESERYFITSWKATEQYKRKARA